MAAKMKKNHVGKVKKYMNEAKEQIIDGQVGQHLHMDFGFVRGSDWKKKDNDGKLVTSIDNYRSYLLIIDRASRYIWIFLTKTKHPPISQVQHFLQRFKGCFNYSTNGAFTQSSVVCIVPVTKSDSSSIGRRMSDMKDL